MLFRSDVPTSDAMNNTETDDKVFAATEPAMPLLRRGSPFCGPFFLPNPEALPTSCGKTEDCGNAYTRRQTRHITGSGSSSKRVTQPPWHDIAPILPEVFWWICFEVKVFCVWECQCLTDCYGCWWRRPLSWAIWKGWFCVQGSRALIRCPHFFRPPYALRFVFRRGRKI